MSFGNIFNTYPSFYPHTYIYEIFYYRISIQQQQKYIYNYHTVDSQQRMNGPYSSSSSRSPAPQSKSFSLMRSATAASGFRDMHMNTPQRNKIIVIRKIIMISSIRKEVKKVMQKLIDNGVHGFDETQTTILTEQAKKILDVDKQKQLSHQLQSLLNPSQTQSLNLPQSILKLIKYFVVSPIQKSYIIKIQKQLKQDEQLQKQIKQIQQQINQQKNNKLTLYDLQKNGKVLGMSTKIVNRKKEVENYENKLMRSNQKLNQLIANNNKLRDKISQLRKEKNAMEMIYKKLEHELQEKNKNVENTIKFANDANNARYQAQKDLKNLKQQAQQKKSQFKKQCQKLNNDIQQDIRFKQFIKSKHIEKEQLDKLQQQIRINQKTIEDKKQSNQRIDKEYKKSIAKEQQIKRAFDTIKKQIGIGDVGVENQGKELLNIFNNLYQKNSIMSNFVEELGREVTELEDKIAAKKKEIQEMYLRGTADESEKQKLNEELRQKVEYQKRKKQILDDQYQKSIETISMIKEYLIQIFEQVNVDAEIIQKLKNCNINEENLTQFLGELQKKGLQAISHYGKLVGQQLKAEKGNSWEIQKQIQELNNIITVDNLNTMNNSTAKGGDYPSQLLIKLQEDKIKDDDWQKLKTLQEFKKYAVDSLQKFQKKQVVKEKPIKNRFAISHQNTYKAKKKATGKENNQND